MKFRKEKKRIKFNKSKNKEKKRNKKNKRNKRYKSFKKGKTFIIIKILSILILSFIYYATLKFFKIKKIVIQVDISQSKHGKDGPIVLQKGLSKVLSYETKYCKFIPID